MEQDTPKPRGRPRKTPARVTDGAISPKIAMAQRVAEAVLDGASLPEIATLRGYKGRYKSQKGYETVRTERVQKLVHSALDYDKSVIRDKIAAILAHIDPANPKSTQGAILRLAAETEAMTTTRHENVNTNAETRPLKAVSDEDLQEELLRRLSVSHLAPVKSGQNEAETRDNPSPDGLPDGGEDAPPSPGEELEPVAVPDYASGRRANGA